MLSRPGPLPVGAGWSHELKRDGFRAIVSTEDKNLGEFGGIISSKKELALPAQAGDEVVNPPDPVDCAGSGVPERGASSM
jgi:hypothetical protein